MSIYRKKLGKEVYKRELRKHKRHMEKNIEILGDYNCFDDYYYLNKLFKGNSLKKKLFDLNRYARKHLLNPSVAKDNSTTIFAPGRVLARKYGSNNGSWNRAINTFYFLGFINKIIYREAQWTQVKNRSRQIKEDLTAYSGVEYKTVSYYHIYRIDKDLLNRANEQAKLLVEKNYKVTTFGKEWLQKNIGEDIADKVYPYNSTLRIFIKDETILFFYMKNLEDYINTYGYVKPKDLKAKVKQDLLINTNDYKVKRAINSRVETFYNLNEEEILQGYKLITKANKEQVQKYNLSGYCKIIIKDN